MVIHPLIQIAMIAVTCAAYWFAYPLGWVEESNLAWLVTAVGPRLFVVFWAQRDAKLTHYRPGAHYPTLMFLLPIFVVPHYVLRTRGAAGLPLAIVLLLAVTAGTWGYGAGLVYGVATEEFEAEDAWAAWWGVLASAWSR